MVFKIILKKTPLKAIFTDMNNCGLFSARYEILFGGIWTSDWVNIEIGSY